MEDFPSANENPFLMGSIACTVPAREAVQVFLGYSEEWWC